MKKAIPIVAFATLLVGSVGYLARTTDEYFEVNAMTGAVRTRTRYAYVFNTPWKVRSTWIADSAARQGIPTEKGWRKLEVVSKRLSTTSTYTSAPVSYQVIGIGPKVLNLTATDEIDHFVHDFVFADESKRREMLSVP